jgi:hypothetical protein
MDAAHSFELLTAARQAKLSFKATCTWAKTSAGMDSLYRSQTEFVHVFKNGGDDVRHTNNVQLGKYGRSRSTLWGPMPAPTSIVRARTRRSPPAEAGPPAPAVASSPSTPEQSPFAPDGLDRPASAKRTGRKEYDVGWKKPPKEHQFKPGNNANPTGRPKGSKNLATILKEKLDKTLQVNWQGKSQKMSVGEVGLTRLVNKFAETGDPKLLLAIAKILPASAPQPNNDAPPDPREQASNEAVLKFIEATLRDGGSLLPPSSEPPNSSGDDDEEGEAA